MSNEQSRHDNPDLARPAGSDENRQPTAGPDFAGDKATTPAEIGTAGSAGNNTVMNSAGGQSLAGDSVAADGAGWQANNPYTVAGGGSVAEPPLDLAAVVPAVIEIDELNFFYGEFQVLRGINMRFAERRITALIGPSGCGKSTLVRVLNRMSDEVPGARAFGSVRVLGHDIFASEADVTALRRDVGMVFQQPNPFPMSVFDNIAFGLRLAGVTDRQRLAETVEASLSAVDLWADLKDRLDVPATNLSADFQQRLCIARAVAVEPKVLLMDEPCSSLDPFATLKVEELMMRLKKKYTIVVVTHSMQQAARISDEVGYLLLGELIEFGPTERVFRNPRDKRTDDYISGKFG